MYVLFEVIMKYRNRNFVDEGLFHATSVAQVVGRITQIKKKKNVPGSSPDIGLNFAAANLSTHFCLLLKRYQNVFISTSKDL